MLAIKVASGLQILQDCFCIWAVCLKTCLTQGRTVFQDQPDQNVKAPEGGQDIIKTGIGSEPQTQEEVV